MTTNLLPEAVDETEEAQLIQYQAVENGGGPDLDDRRTKKRRRWPWVLGLIAAGAAAGTMWAVSSTPSTDAAVGTGAVVVNTATVEQQDIIEFIELDGTLTFADPITWFSATDGTVTAIVEAGTVLDRGDVVVELDEAPVVLFYGDVPPYRTLAEGVEEGDDVAQLEENLVVLGYDENYDIVIDGEFDSATGAAVEAWQADIGVEVTGVVAASDYLVAAGPVQVQHVQAGWGARIRVDAIIAQVVAFASDAVVVSPVDGTVLDTVSVGATIKTGDILLETTEALIPAIVGGDRFERDLSEGDEGDDVRQLEETLLALGYDANGDLSVDDLYDEATEKAVSDWEADLGIEEDGIFATDQVVVTPESFVVSAVLVGLGDEIAAGQPIYESSTSERIVTTQIDVVDQTSLAVGDLVTVELADGSEIEAIVASISAVAQIAANDPDGEPYLDVLLDISAASIGLDLVESPVAVSIVDSIAEDVTVVPASALIALREGGYAVEIVSGGSTQLVGVETGDFNDGYVELLTDAVVPGTEVVVP